MLEVSSADFDQMLDTPVETPTPTQTPPKQAPVPQPAERAPVEDDEQPEQPEDEQQASEAGKTLAQHRNKREKRLRSIQSEIDDLVFRRESTRRDLDELERRRESARREPAQPPQAEARRQSEPRPWDDPRDPRPRLDQFQEWNDFDDAREAWSDRQSERRQQFLSQREGQQRSHHERMTAYQSRLEQHRANDPAFDEAMEDAGDLPFTRPMQDALFDSQIPGQLLRYLAEHPEEHDRIYKEQRPLKAYGEMQKLEARLEAAQTGPAPIVKRSQAKAPLKPVQGAPVVDTAEVPGDDVSIEDHIARMNARDRKRRRL